MLFHFSSNLYIPKKEVAIYIFVIEKRLNPHFILPTQHQMEHRYC